MTANSKNQISPMREIYNALELRDLNTLKRLFGSSIYIEQLSWEDWDAWQSGWESYPVESLTPLEKAADLGDIEIINLFLEKGRNLPDWRFPLGKALHFACESGNTELVKIFIRAKAGIGHLKGTKYMKDSSFLEAAIYGGNLGIVRLLIEFGFDVNGNKRSFTPLMAAANINNLSITKYLVEAGADVNQPDESQWNTALIQAAYYAHQEVFDYLLPLSNPEAIKIARDNFGKFSVSKY